MNFYRSKYYHISSLTSILAVLAVSVFYASNQSSWEFYHFTIFVLLLIFYLKTLGQPLLSLTSGKIKFYSGFWIKGQEIDFSKIVRLEVRGKGIYFMKRLIIYYLDAKQKNKKRVLYLGVVENWQSFLENLKNFTGKNIEIN